MSKKPDLALFAAVAAAKSLADLFGSTAAATDASIRKLRANIHADLFGGDDTAWRRLDELIAAARGPAAPPSLVFAPFEVRAGKTTYAMTSLLAAGDLCDVYATERDGVAAVAKVARDPRDNDLLAAEAAALRVVSPRMPTTGLTRLLPHLLDTFEVKSGGERRRVNVITRASTAHKSPDAEYVTLAQVRAVYPDGLDFRDVAWIARRMLGALGLVHSLGYVHAAVLPAHVLVHPTEHDALLVDWCYAVPAGSKGRALVKGSEQGYPPELVAGKPLGPQADVYMFGQCVAQLLGADTSTHAQTFPASVPREIRSFVLGTQIVNPARRSADAWALHDDLGKILDGLVGPPTFRRLAMPAASTTTITT